MADDYSGWGAGLGGDNLYSSNFFSGGGTGSVGSGGTSDWSWLQNLAPLATAALGAYSAGQGTNTTTNTNNVPSWQAPYLQAGFGAASQLFGQGPQQYFPGSTVAPLSQTTLSALSRMGGDPSMWGNVQNYLMGSLGQSPGAYQVKGQQSALSSLLGGRVGMDGGASSFFSRLMNGRNGITAPTIGSGSYSAADSGERNYVNDVLGGKYLNAGNPYADRIASQLADDVQARVGSQFGAAGRSSSGAAARALAEQTGDTLANFRGGLYENERNRMGEAAGLANTISGRSDQANQFNIGNALQAAMFNASNNMGAQQFNAGQRFNAATAAQNAALNRGQLMLGGLNAANAFGSRMDQANQFGQTRDLSAIGMLPGLDQARRAGNQEAFGAGQYLDQYAQSQLNDQVNRFNFNQESPWQNIARYMQLVGGNGYGGQTSAFTPGNPLAGALGGLQLGAGIFGK